MILRVVKEQRKRGDDGGIESACNGGDSGVCWVIGEENELSTTADTVSPATRLEKVPTSVDMETKH